MNIVYPTPRTKQHLSLSQKERQTETNREKKRRERQRGTTRETREVKG